MYIIRTLWNVHDCYRDSCYDVIYDKRRSITEYPLEDWDVNEEEFEPRSPRKGRGQGTADRLRREDGLESFPQWECLAFGNTRVTGFETKFILRFPFYINSNKKQLPFSYISPQNRQENHSC